MFEFEMAWQVIMAQLEVWHSVPDHQILEEKVHNIKDVVVGTPDYAPVFVYEQYKGREGGSFETTAGKLRDALKMCTREEGRGWYFVLEGLGVHSRFSGFHEQEHYYSLWIPDLTYEI